MSDGSPIKVRFARYGLLVTAAGLIAGAAAADPLVIDGIEIAGSELNEAAQAEGLLVYYGTYPTASAESIHAAFTEDTGIEIEYIRAPTGSLHPRITTEASADQLGADIVDLSDLPLVEQLVEVGVLDTPYKTPFFNDIPDDLKEAEGRWYTMIRPVYIMVANTAVLESEMPTRWADLLDPALRGRLGIPSIDAGGSAFSAYTFLREEMGEAFLTDLAAQQPRIYPSVSPTMNDLVRGETSVAMAATGLVEAQIAQGAPVEPIFPEEGLPSFPVAGGIATSAAHPNAAKLYMNWITSPVGSRAVGQTGAYGIHPDVEAPKTEWLDYPPVDQVWTIGLEQWRQVREQYIADWHQTFDRN